MLNRIGPGLLLPLLALGAGACGGGGAQGKSEGESCTETAQCRSGLTCLSMVCSPEQWQDVLEDELPEDVAGIVWSEVRLPECFPDCSAPESITWITIPGGTFQMGCSPNDDMCEESEKPRHAVTLTGFQMLETEVTQAQFAEVMHYDPSWNWAMGGGPDNPVESVGWSTAQAFCVVIGGRLPTEAQWEYAARGGTETRYYCGDDPACLEEIAWLGTQWPPGKHPVKQKKPNAFGLYDMIGNVLEWTSDWSSPTYYQQSPDTDPKGPEQGSERIARGATFHPEHFQFDARVSCRNDDRPPSAGGHYLGFRCVRAK